MDCCSTKSATAHRGILDYDIPMEWIDTSEMEVGPDEPNFREQFVGESFGRVNKGEALLTLNTLRNYYTKIGKQRVLDEQIDVGVISPYRAQVQYLRGLIKRDAFFKPFRHLVTVNTVDGFQGQERDIILISMVRANDDGQIGFLRDPLRMKRDIKREAILNIAPQFVQVSQKAIVNVDYLLEVADNTCVFYPPFERVQNITVGRHYRKALTEKFNSI